MRGRLIIAGERREIFEYIDSITGTKTFHRPSVRGSDRKKEDYIYIYIMNNSMIYMAREERVQEAYQIMVKIDGMYHQGRFDEVNDILRNMDLNSMTDQALVTYLCVSKWAKVKLPSRLEFYKKVEEVLKNRGRQTKELLQGLE